MDDKNIQNSEYTSILNQLDEPIKITFYKFNSSDICDSFTVNPRKEYKYITKCDSGILNMKINSSNIGEWNGPIPARGSTSIIISTINMDDTSSSLSSINVYYNGFYIPGVYKNKNKSFNYMIIGILILIMLILFIYLVYIRKYKK